MLTAQEIKKIEEFVYSKPRSIQEIAEHIKKNWRTADRYIQEIENSFGTITTRVFRGGTRGALKIVYWASVEKISNSVFQEKLEEEMIKAKRKEDFSAFDIFEHVADKNKKAHISKNLADESENIEELAEMLNKAEKQVLIFSGNLSFVNLKNKKHDMMKVMENLVKRGIDIKIISRIDLAGKENIEKMLSLNYKFGKEVVEIHHNEHPIRAFIVDKKVFRIKEVKEPTGRINELNKKVLIFYTIRDKEWTEWLSKIFWKKFSQSTSAIRRIEELDKLR